MSVLQDNEKLRQELEQLKAAANLSKQQAVAKPKPVPKRLQKHGKSKQDEPQSEEESCASDEAEPEEEVESEDERELSEAAKKQRLRRVCQRKPSGKLSVPESVHEMWKKGGHMREELQELLEESGWDKDQTIPNRFPPKSSKLF